MRTAGWVKQSVVFVSVPLAINTTQVFYSKEKMAIKTLLWLTQLQLNDVMSLLHCVTSLILLKLNACVHCLGCIYVTRKQPTMGGHCYVMLDGLWTVLYSIIQPHTFLGGYPIYTFCTFFISVQCQVLRKQN